MRKRGILIILLLAVACAGGLTLALSRDPRDFLDLVPSSVPVALRCQECARHLDELWRSPSGRVLQKAWEEPGRPGMVRTLRDRLEDLREDLGVTPKSWMLKELLGRDFLLGISLPHKRDPDLLLLTRLGPLGRAGESLFRVARRISAGVRGSSQVNRFQGWTFIEFPTESGASLCYGRSKDILVITTSRDLMEALAVQRSQTGPKSGLRLYTPGSFIQGFVNLDQVVPILEQSLEGQDEISSLARPILADARGKRIRLDVSRQGLKLAVNDPNALDSPEPVGGSPLDLPSLGASECLFLTSWRTENLGTSAAAYLSKNPAAASFLGPWDEAARRMGYAGLEDMLSPFGGFMVFECQDIRIQGKMPLPSPVLMVGLKDTEKAKAVVTDLMDRALSPSLYGLPFQEDDSSIAPIRFLPGSPGLCYSFFSNYLFLGTEVDAVQSALSRWGTASGESLRDEMAPWMAPEDEEIRSVSVIHWVRMAETVDEMAKAYQEALAYRGWERDMRTLSDVLRTLGPTVRTRVRMSEGEEILWRFSFEKSSPRRRNSNRRA